MRAKPQRTRPAGAATFAVLSLASVLGVACTQTAPVTSQVPSGVVPAKLAVTAPAGAEIHFDGVMVGQAPLGSEIDADPGPHSVGVVLAGHAPRVQQVSLERGKTRAVDIELETTAQRKAAWVLIALGGAGVAGGIVLGALAFVEQRKADDLEGGFAQPMVGYQDAIDARDRYRVGAGGSAGAGIGLFVTGALLYAFDEAVLPSSASADRIGFRLLGPPEPGDLGAVPSFQMQW
jgi:hypothetical protein